VVELDCRPWGRGYVVQGRGRGPEGGACRAGGGAEGAHARRLGELSPSPGTGQRQDHGRPGAGSAEAAPLSPAETSGPAMGDRERNKKRLLELLQAAGTGNTHCADCGAEDPDWASYKLGIFICLHCSGVHRNFPDVSKVKSVRLDFWDDSMVEFMTHNGNLNVKAKFEARVPAFYYVPQASDCLSNGFELSDREGFLWKRGRDNAQFLRRRFVLLAREGLLKYYTKEEITYRKEEHTRNLFVYHDSGKEIVDWFNALRAARLQYLKLTFPDLSESELVPLTTRNYLKQGFMEKTGPKHKEPFKKRWFALDPLERRLLYYKNPLDAFEQGQVFLGSNEQGYEVCEDLPRGIRGNRWKVGLTVVTPERKFIFTCPSEKEQREWLESLQDVLSSPLSPLHLLTASAESGCGLRKEPRDQQQLPLSVNSVNME
ncbi:hypothetical protein U0070_003475, partial [Myodes glareolus]